MQQTTYYLVAWLMLVLGLSYFIHAARWQKLALEIARRERLPLLALILFLVLGLYIAISHNIWGWQLSVVVTLVGWLIALKSAIYLVFMPPLKFLRNWPEQRLMTILRIDGVVFALLGAALLLNGPGPTGM